MVGLGRAHTQWYVFGPAEIKPPFQPISDFVSKNETSFQNSIDDPPEPCQIDWRVNILFPLKGGGTADSLQHSLQQQHK
jgi:hypothetical protein